MSIGLLATGDELTHGDTLNTSTQVIASILSSEGFSMGMHVVCGDKEQELVDALSFLGKKHQVIIVTGGLGPTSDDRTRFALARYLEQPLYEYAEACLHIEIRLTRAKLLMDESNRQQALFPKKATLFPNEHGTAMGCSVYQNEQIFILLPGPPKECMPMFQTAVLPLLKQHISSSQKEMLTWRLFGVAEGQMAAILERALAGIDCHLGYCLETPYLIFKVRCEKSYLAEVRAIIDPLVAPYIIAPTNETASMRLSAWIEEHKIKVTIFDDVTGGVLQSLLQKPANHAYLSFRDKEHDQAGFYFHASGLEAYWQGESRRNGADVVLTYRLCEEMEGEDHYTLPRMGAWATQTVAEWLSFRIFSLVNQVHDFLA